MLKTHLQTIHVIFTLPHSRKELELFKETKVANTNSVKSCNFCESKIKRQKSLKPHLQTIHVIPTLSGETNKNLCTINLVHIIPTVK